MGFEFGFRYLIMYVELMVRQMWDTIGQCDYRAG